MGAHSESFCRHFGFRFASSDAFWRYKDIVHLLLTRVGMWISIVFPFC